MRRLSISSRPQFNPNEIGRKALLEVEKCHVSLVKIGPTVTAGVICIGKSPKTGVHFIFTKPKRQLSTLGRYWQSMANRRPFSCIHTERARKKKLQPKETRRCMRGPPTAAGMK